MPLKDKDPRIVWRDKRGRAFIYNTCIVCDTITLVRLNRVKGGMNVSYCGNDCRLEDLKQGHTKNFHLEHQARIEFRRAMIAGLIYKEVICKFCGKISVHLQAHHEDYAFPLIVIWLCTPCHRKYHIEIGREERIQEKPLRILLGELWN